MYSFLIVDIKFILNSIHMGIRLDKINISRPDMICPVEFEDFTQARSVYIVIHKPKKEDKKCEIEKRQHFAVAIDVTGIENNTF